MQNVRRNLITSAVLAIVAIYAHFWASSWWFRFVVEGQSHVTTWEWLDIGHLKIWLFEIAWGLALGALVALSVRSPRPLRWALACGTVVALFDFATSRNYFYPTTPASIYVWAYGTYLMPALGAVLGALVVLGGRRAFQRGGVHAA